jgi:hypothetical protein
MVANSALGAATDKYIELRWCRVREPALQVQVAPVATSQISSPILPRLVEVDSASPSLG